MTTRRSFLSSLALGAGALLVGDAALEAYERLTHRKVWAGWSAPKWGGRMIYPDEWKVVTAPGVVVKDLRWNGHSVLFRHEVDRAMAPGQSAIWCIPDTQIGDRFNISTAWVGT